MIKEDTVTRLLDNENESGELTRKAVTLLAEAAAVQRTLHLPGVCDAYRWRLEQVVLLAGQLSRGAQRAPTLEDCDDGWQRVQSPSRPDQFKTAYSRLGLSGAVHLTAFS